MKITATHNSLSEIEEEALVVPVFEGENPREGALAALDHLTNGAVRVLFDNGEVDGKRDRWAMLYDAGTLRARRLLLYGAGKPGDTGSLNLQRLAGASTRALASRRIASAAFLLRSEFETEEAVRAIVEGAIIGKMNGELYRSDSESPPPLERLTLAGESASAQDFQGAITMGTVMAEAVNFARTLVYEPGNVMTPEELSRRAEQMAAEFGLGFESLDEPEMKRLGMGALLAVSRGSNEQARLIVLRYEPEADPARAPNSELIALVGKGITFDSGGISIKPAENMEEMKYDMSGGAAVIGAMQVISQLRPQARVIGLVPASENLPSGRAYKPGDVLRSLSGKTIEVVNTDAEGRLILADAITYAISQGATRIVDAATLTGACVIALGDVRAAVFGTDQRLIDDLVSAGEQSGERLWQLPIDREYNELIRSDIADMKNSGGRLGGAITAAMFLMNFAGTVPWAHLDIAGTAWLDREKPYSAKGATGFGVRLMANFIMNTGVR